MNVAVLCEMSGRVRDAFVARGHRAVSFDLVPMKAAAGFFHWCLEVAHVVENPNPMYKLAGLPHWSQVIQPFEHGHGVSKATCLWLRTGVRHLRASHVVVPGGSGVLNVACGPGRGRVRSLTYPGIAAAMAEQWG